MCNIDARAQDSSSDQGDSQSSSRITPETSVQAPREGETRRFDERELNFSESVHVLASHASIVGHPERTKIHCPKNGGAFVIKFVSRHKRLIYPASVRGRNITLMRLDFIGCVNGSAIGIEDDDASSLCRKDGQPGCTAGRLHVGRGSAGECEAIVCYADRSLFVDNSPRGVLLILKQHAFERGSYPRNEWKSARATVKL